MKYYEYEEWLDSNYLTTYYTDEELDDLYNDCMKMISFLKLTKNPDGNEVNDSFNAEDYKID